ncbi:MAG: DUF2007 domain-containing protein [Anaeromyxobacteraceae bacterium]
MPVDQHWADFRTVAVFGSTPDAERARGLLESDGIVAAVQDAVEDAPRPDVLCIRLLVPASDLARARDLLAPDLEREHHAEPVAAPAPEVDATWTVAWLALLAAALAALLAAFSI